MPTRYFAPLVMLSYIVAMLASHVTLSLAGVRTEASWVARRRRA